MARSAGGPAREKLEVLRGLVGEAGRCAVAFSGGVDSTFLLAVAAEVGGGDCLAVTAVGPLYPRQETARAAALAEGLGVQAFTVASPAMELESFTANPPERCYHCKHALFSAILAEAAARGYPVLFDGSNADDLRAYRPGARAASELGVRSPLQEAGLGKAEIRELSREVYDLPTAARPAMACLATRIPYGSPITKEKLGQIEELEGFLAARGFTELRARHHGALVRIEVPPADLPRLVEPELRAACVERAAQLGFTYVTLDLRGLRSGSMDEVLEPR